MPGIPAEDRFRHARDVVPALQGARQRRAMRLGLSTAAAALALIGLIAVPDWGDRAGPCGPADSGFGPLRNAQHLQGRQVGGVFVGPGRAGRRWTFGFNPSKVRPARRLTHHAAEDTDASISPDGKLVAFRSERDDGGVYAVGADGLRERLLAARARSPSVFAGRAQHCLLDGLAVGLRAIRTSVCDSGQRWCGATGGGRFRRRQVSGMELLQWRADVPRLPRAPRRPLRARSCGPWVPTEGNRPTGALALLRQERIEMRSPPRVAWQGDRLVFGGSRDSLLSLWELALLRKDPSAAGPARRITSGEGSEREPSVAPNGTVAFGRGASSMHIWRVPIQIGGSEPAVEVTSDLPDGCPNLSRDGKWLFFTRSRLNARDVFAKDLVSGQESVLFASEEDKLWPISNASGDHVVFESRRQEGSWIGLIVRGQPPRRLCSECSHPTSWFDGDRAVFHTTPKGEIAILDLESGASKVVLAGGNGAALAGADWSPEQEFLLFTANQGGAANQVLAVHFPRDGAAPEGPWIKIAAEWEQADLPHWSPDGKSLFYLSRQDGHLCIWGRRFDAALRKPAGGPFPVMHYHDPRTAPERSAPKTRGLAVGRNAVFVNVGATTEAIWTGALTGPPPVSWFRRLFSE